MGLIAHLRKEAFGTLIGKAFEPAERIRRVSAVRTDSSSSTIYTLIAVSARCANTFIPPVH